MKSGKIDLNKLVGKGLPEMIEIKIDNSSLGDIKQSMIAEIDKNFNSILRAIESSVPSISRVQSSVKKVDSSGFSELSVVAPKEFEKNIQNAIDYTLAKFPSVPVLNSSDERERLSYSISNVDKATFNKQIHGEDAFKVLQAKVLSERGVVYRNPTKGKPDRVTIEVPYRDDTVYEGTDEDIKRQKLNAKTRFSTYLTKDAVKISNASIKQEEIAKQEKDKIREERDKEKETKENERKEKESERKTIAGIKQGTAMLAVLTDITRRILTSTLNFASQMNKQGVEARNVGMSYSERRGLDIFDIAHGLQAGTSFGAVSSIQTKFGDKTNLDTKALEVLARVMGNDISSLVNAGTGSSDPETLLNSILDAYFNQYKQGKNSLGEVVGSDKARRELVTVLQGIAPEIATVFSKMVDDFESGMYSFTDATGWRGTTETNISNIQDFEFKRAEEVGMMWNQIKATTADIASLFSTTILIGLSDIINKISQLRMFESPSVKLETDAKNREQNTIKEKEVTEALQNRNKASQLRIDEMQGNLVTALSRYKQSDLSSFSYSTDTIAGVVSGYYGMNAIKSMGSKIGVDPKSNASALAYIARAKELYEVGLTEEGLGASLASSVVLFQVKKQLEEEQEKAEGSGIKAVTLTEAELVTKTQALIKYELETNIGNTHNAPQGYIDLALKAYIKWLQAENTTSEKEKTDYSDLKTTFLGTEGGTFNKDMMNYAKNVYDVKTDEGVKNKVLAEINDAKYIATEAKRKQTGNPTALLTNKEIEQIYLSVLAPLGVKSWNSSNLSVLPDASSKTYMKAEIEARANAVKQTEEEMFSSIVNSYNIPSSATSYNATSQNGTLTIQFLDKSGKVIHKETGNSFSDFTSKGDVIINNNQVYLQAGDINVD